MELNTSVTDKVNSKNRIFRIFLIKFYDFTLTCNSFSKTEAVGGTRYHTDKSKIHIILFIRKTKHHKTPNTTQLTPGVSR